VNLKIALPIIDTIVRNHNLENDKFFKLSTDFLQPSFDNPYHQPLVLSPIDPNNIPSEYDVTISKRQLGDVQSQILNPQELTSQEAKYVLKKSIKYLDSLYEKIDGVHNDIY